MIKKLILLTFLFVSLSQAQIGARKVYADTVKSFADAGPVYIQDSTRFQLQARLDSIAIPAIPPYAGVHLFSRGMLGLFVQYPDGTVHNLDSATGGGGLSWADTLTNLATAFDISTKADLTAVLKNADSTAIRNNSNYLYLENADSTSIRNYSDFLYQPKDADLTTYAGITPSANMQTFLGSADFAAMRTNLSLVVGTNVQAYDADLTTYAGITPSANIQSFLGSADYATARSNLGLAIGTNVQAYDADLTTYAGITPSANIQSFLGSADYATARSNLGVAIGTNVQAYDADLSTIAGLTATTDNFIVSVTSAWASRTPAQVRTTLGLVIGTNVQAYDADLTTYAGITPSANIQTFLGSADYSAARTNLGVAIGTNVQAYDADLGTIAGLTATTGNFIKSVSSAWSSVALADTVFKGYGFYGLSAADSGYIFEVPASSANYTVRSIRAIYSGSAAPVIYVRNVTDANAVCNDYTVTTSMAAATLTANTTLSAGDMIRVVMKSGTITELFVQIVMTRPL